MVIIRGHFDGRVLVPDEPVDLPRNTPLVLHVGVVSKVAETNSSGLFQVLLKHAASVEAPADWSSEHDHYLYGLPKRQDR